MVDAKLALLACQAKTQKRLVVELMSLLEVLQKGLPGGTHHCVAAQTSAMEIPPVHSLFFGGPHRWWLEGLFRNWKWLANMATFQNVKVSESYQEWRAYSDLVDTSKSMV